MNVDLDGEPSSNPQKVAQETGHAKWLKILVEGVKAALGHAVVWCIFVCSQMKKNSRN